MVEVTGTEREGCVPDSWWVVEDDGRTRRQMAHSSTARSSSSLGLKDKKEGEGQNVST